MRIQFIVEIIKYDSTYRKPDETYYYHEGEELNSPTEVANNELNDDNTIDNTIWKFVPLN